MILLKALLRRIVQTNHVPRPHRDKIIARARLREQRTSLRLRACRPVAARRREAKHVVAVARDDVHRRRGRGGFLQAAADGQQLAQADDVLVGEIELEDAFVVGARFAPEVGAAAGHGGGDEVGRVVGGEAGGAVEVGGEEDGLGEVGGDGDDGDAVASEDESGDVGRVVRCLGVAEDGAVGVTDVDDAIKGAAWWGVSLGVDRKELWGGVTWDCGAGF